MQSRQKNLDQLWLRLRVWGTPPPPRKDAPNGATIITGKRAPAFKALAGDIIYVLFEETYEKNCDPHTPGWSCRFIGGLDEAVRQIFRWASSCEGGMLQSRTDHIKPEDLIASWLKELQVPHEMPDLNITLKIGTNSMYDAIPENKASEAALSSGEQCQFPHIDIGNSCSRQCSI